MAHVLRLYSECLCVRRTNQCAGIVYIQFAWFAVRPRCVSGASARCCARIPNIAQHRAVTHVSNAAYESVYDGICGCMYVPLVAMTRRPTQFEDWEYAARRFRGWGRRRFRTASGPFGTSAMAVVSYVTVARRRDRGDDGALFYAFPSKLSHRSEGMWKLLPAVPLL